LLDVVKPQIVNYNIWGGSQVQLAPAYDIRRTDCRVLRRNANGLEEGEPLNAAIINAVL
jgi:hypothetical protein